MRLNCCRVHAAVCQRGSAPNADEWLDDALAKFAHVQDLQVSKFYDFIRNASDEERKAVYEEVLAKATTRQLEVLHTAKEEAAKQSGVDEDELE